MTEPLKSSLIDLSWIASGSVLSIYKYKEEIIHVQEREHIGIIYSKSQL